MKCKEKGCRRKAHSREFCFYHYHKHFMVDIPVFSYLHVKKQTHSLFTNGDTDEVRALIPKIKEKVLNDCIRNPRKYL